VPGYGDSFATKYGATRNAPFKESYYRDTNVYKLDHFAIPLMMFDYIRRVNLHDSSLFGQIAGINLIRRNLFSDNVSLQQDRNRHRETLEPRGPGRLFTLSEAALVIHKTASGRVVSWSEGSGPRFEDVGGQQGDGNVVKRIAANEHPKHASWIGREYCRPRLLLH